ncbi:MAG: glycosyltransferase [Oligoflexia bacterium]|nr:glycosyltransferase [Oligoflexia bacterium]
MEILHFCPSRSYSGLEQYAFQMAAEQKKKGKSVAFVVFPGSKLEEECKKAGLQVIPYDFHPALAPIKFWWKLKRVFDSSPELSVIHLHSTQEIFHIYGAMIYRKFFRFAFKSVKPPKIILQIHIWLNHRKQDPFHTALYSLVDEVWCSSGSAKEALIKNLPVSPSKIRIVNYGRDIEKTENGFLTQEKAREELKLPQNVVIFGTVSRLEESKGIKEFLEGGIEFLRKHPQVHLAIIGGASPNNPEAEKYTQELNQMVDVLENANRSRIHFLGTVHDSYKYLKALDVYVLPSYEECFSLALLDAQLAALPVAGTQSGGTPEIVCEGETGWLFKPRDAKALNVKMEVALTIQDQWPTFGARAKARVKKDFDQAQIFDQILNYYKH